MYRYLGSHLNFKILEDFPKIPDHLIEKSFQGMTEARRQIESMDDFQRTDSRTVSPEIKAWIVNDLEFVIWMAENVNFVKGIDKNIVYRKVYSDKNKNFYPPHIDVYRKFVVMYNLSSASGELVFWKEKGKPIFRGGENFDFIRNYDDLEELERFYIPEKTWYIVNSQVIHSVENLSGNREGYQFSVEPRNPIVRKNLNPIFEKVS